MTPERRAAVVRELRERQHDQLVIDVARLRAQVNELTLLVFDLLDQTGYKTKPVKLIRPVERPRL